MSYPPWLFGSLGDKRGNLELGLRDSGFKGLGNGLCFLEMQRERYFYSVNIDAEDNVLKSWKNQAIR